MLPDTGERYLSTPLFEDVAVTMTEEVMTISRSTAGYRFDVSAPAAATATEEQPLDKAAVSINKSRLRLLFLGLMIILVMHLYNDRCMTYIKRVLCKSCGVRLTRIVLGRCLDFM